MATSIQPTGVERHFDEGEILVSKTDTRGRITYCNQQFRDIAGYSNQHLVGEPHSCVRHPDMPRSVFKILWDALSAKREVFAYVKNLSSNGDHYWVFAHVTPSYDGNGDVVGYHSARRAPNRTVLNEVIEPLYKDLVDIENRPANRKQGLEDAHKHLTDILDNKECLMTNLSSLSKARLLSIIGAVLIAGAVAAHLLGLESGIDFALSAMAAICMIGVMIFVQRTETAVKHATETTYAFGRGDLERRANENLEAGSLRELMTSINYAADRSDTFMRRSCGLDKCARCQQVLSPYSVGRYAWWLPCLFQSYQPRG